MKALAAADYWKPGGINIVGAVMKKLYRSETDRKIAGICGGLGEIYGIDSNLIRIAFIFVALITHVIPLVITYLIAWLILLEFQNKK